jgi:hypothetical protein
MGRDEKRRRRLDHRHAGLARTPQQIANELGQIRELALDVFGQYRALYDLGHSASSRAEAHVQTDATDPTGELVASEAKSRLRGHALSADEAIANAHAALRAAQTAVQRGLFSPRDPIKPAGRFPRSVTAAELRESRKAQRRRAERGES